jgi:acetyl esterase
MSTTIDPDTERLLEALATTGGPSVDELSVEEARRSATMRSVIASLGGAPLEPVAVGSVSALEVPTPAGPVATRIYRPSVPVGDPPPLIVWFHGGGFVLGDLESADPSSRALCAGAGAIVVNVDYPLAPEHPFPAAPEACWAVTAWLAERHASIGFDPARLAVGGESAGGNLAAATALLAAERGGPAIHFQLLVYPMLDASTSQPSIRSNGQGYFLTAERIEWFWGHYLPDAAQRTNPIASPLDGAALAGQPPAAVITAELDPLRDEAEAYADRLRAAGVAATTTRYDGLVHGFVTMASLSARAREGLEGIVAACRDGLTARE